MSLAVAGLALAAWGCDPERSGAPAADVRGDTPGMVRRLAAMADTVDPIRNRFANSVLVERIERTPAGEDPMRRLSRRRLLAEQRLLSGDHEGAVVEFEGLLEELNSHLAPGRRPPMPDFERDALDLLAVTYLRWAETANCVESGGAVDCRIPRPRTIWTHRTDAVHSAIALYELLLADEPEALGPLWLLNVSWMMIGGWPDSVPPRWRIPFSAFEERSAIGEFPDRASDLGLDVVGHVGGSVMDDLDGDGLLDILATSWGLRDSPRMFRNEGDGSFRDVSASAGLEELTGGGNVVQADYDNDGDLDLFVTRGGWLADGYPNSLLRNRGDGTFEDVTEAAGLLTPHPTQTAAWGDYDNDGWLDLVVGNETFGDEPHPTQLFHNERDGTFRDVAAASGTAVVGVVKGVVWGDVDNDGLPDLYISRRGQPNILLRNAGPGQGVEWSFEDWTVAAGVGEPIDAFPAWFWDYDNDGSLDLYVAGYRTRFGDVAAEYLNRVHDSELPRLYRNRGDGTFEDATKASGLDGIHFAMGANFGDLDNDGWLDFYVGTGDAFFQALMPNRMFRNNGGRVFEEVTTSGGFGLFQKGHGVAFGDLDNDGDEDLYVTMGGAYEGDLGRNVLWENPGHGHAWLTLMLEGVDTNRSAIGTRVSVALDTPGGPRTIHRIVGSGGSFGASSLRLEIGLGDATAVRAVNVFWPVSGRRVSYDGVSVNAAYRIREDTATAHRVELPRLRLGG